jgi:hypothetical protein
MEVYMELSKKTTVLFSHEQFSNLKKLAKARRRSIGDLIRSACEKQYGLVPHEEALEASEALSKLSLPVGTVEEMKKQLNPLKKYHQV